MLTVKDVYDFINSMAPFDTAMEFDNSGLLVGNFNKEISNVMISLDVTNEVIEEACENNVDLIVSHHPVIFKPLKRLRSDSIPYLLAKYEIDVICAHTNLDVSKFGVNSFLADKLELKNIRPLSIYKESNFNKIVVFVPRGYEQKIIDSMANNGAGTLGEYSKCSFQSAGLGSFMCGVDSDPFIGEKSSYETVDEVRVEMICPEIKTKSIVEAMIEVHPYEVPAYDIFQDKALSETLSLGLIGDLDDVMNSRQFARYVKEKLMCDGVRYTDCDRKIKSVGLCSGAGGGLVSHVIDNQVDAFVTGEIKHSQILELNSKNITLVDAGHFKTENVYVDRMAKAMNDQFKDLCVLKSLTCSDKIKYV